MRTERKPEQKHRVSADIGGEQVPDIDAECVSLCRAINRIPGLRTIESCCGHGKWPFRVWFLCGDAACLPILLYYVDPCHVGFQWWCKVKTDCAMSPIRFYVESQVVGKAAYKQAKRIASEVNRFMDEDFQRKKKDLLRKP